MKEYFILAIDEKDKLEFIEEKLLSSDSIECFRVRANTFTEAVKKASNQSNKRYFRALSIKRI